MLRVLCSLAVFVLVASSVSAQDAKLQLKLRSLTPAKGEEGKYERVTKEESWNAAKTAIIVCEMWDTHHCCNAVKRVEELAPRMNKVLEKARSMGVLIIHSPSSCMKPYEETAARKRAKDAPKSANLPKEIDQWCRFIPSEGKEKYPVDQSDGGCDSNPTEEKAPHAKLTAMGRDYKAPWLSQIDVIKIDGEAWQARGPHSGHVRHHVPPGPLAERVPFRRDRSHHRSHRKVRLPHREFGATCWRSTVPIQGRPRQVT